MAPPPYARDRGLFLLRGLIGRDLTPGPGPELRDVPTFLLSGPYAPRAERERVDAELRRILDLLTPTASEPPRERSQRVTANDLAHGQIRLQQPARRFFPPKRSTVEVVLRGTRVTAGYDPRVGPDRNRSPVLRIGGRLRDLVSENEVLSVTRGLGGVLTVE